MGHDHDYERFAPQTPGGRLAPAFGLREVVVGTGGAGLRPFFDVQPYSRVRIANRHGAMVLRLSTGRYTGRFRTVSGIVRDSFSGSCHGGPDEGATDGSVGEPCKAVGRCSVTTARTVTGWHRRPTRPSGTSRQPNVGGRLGASRRLA